LSQAGSQAFDKIIVLIFQRRVTRSAVPVHRSHFGSSQRAFASQKGGAGARACVDLLNRQRSGKHGPGEYPDSKLY
jgi:hypothetical protein